VRRKNHAAVIRIVSVLCPTPRVWKECMSDQNKNDVYGLFTHSARTVFASSAAVAVAKVDLRSNITLQHPSVATLRVSNISILTY
jgi:hypothetical protein